MIDFPLIHSTLEWNCLIFVTNSPREQIGVMDILPVLQSLAQRGLTYVTEPAPGMPDQNIWMATALGAQYVKDWQTDGSNRQRQYGTSAVLP